jgi:hypothetical protein
VNRRTLIAAFVTLLILAVPIAVANANKPKETFDNWLTNLHDSLEQGKSRRTSVSLLKKSKSFQYKPEESSVHLSHGITFRFHNNSGGRLIIYLPDPSSSEAFLKTNGKTQRIFASQRYDARHGIEIIPRSKEEQRLIELVRTASLPPHEQDVQLLLNAIEKRTFDWSLWRGMHCDLLKQPPKQLLLLNATEIENDRCVSNYDHAGKSFLSPSMSSRKSSSV